MLFHFRPLMARAISLHKAFLTGSVPRDGGFVIAAIFDASGPCSIYEITAYSGVQDVQRTSDGYHFTGDANRTHILVEPSKYPQKNMQPCERGTGRSIPYRFHELEMYTCAKHERIMIPKEPLLLHETFTVFEQKSDYLSFIFYLSRDVFLAMHRFISDSLYNECSLNKRDSTTSAAMAIETMKKFSVIGTLP